MKIDELYRHTHNENEMREAEEWRYRYTAHKKIFNCQIVYHYVIAKK
jgi:hypothetical protein